MSEPTQAPVPDVDAIEARAKAALYEPCARYGESHLNHSEILRCTGPCLSCDADILRSMSLDIPALVAEVRRLREREAKLRGVIADFERQGRVYPGMTVYRLKEILDA